MQKQEKRKISIAKDTNRFQALILRTTNQINDLENERKIIHLRYQSERKKIETLNNLRAKIEKLYKKKKSELYNVEMEAQKNEIRLQHMMNIEKDKDEVLRKQNIIENLEKNYSMKTSSLKILQIQVDHLDVSLKSIFLFLFY